MPYTDSELSAISGIPERSLRELQTYHFLYADKAPNKVGGFKRSWPDGSPERIAMVAELFNSGVSLKNAIELVRRGWRKIEA
jgi:hypothetical protein